MSCPECKTLEQRIAALEAENERLRHQSAHSIKSTKQLESCAEQTPPVEPLSPSANAPNTLLSRAEMQRYSRQMLVPDFRVSRQLLLRQARVLVIGAGGLGCPVALYLGSMGVGCMGIVDDDRVERSNLHRQIGHDESTLGEFKVHSLAKRVRLINPDVVVETHVVRLSALNAAELVERYDVVVDASDNPATRYLINDVCARARKPLVSGSALGLEGQVTVFTYEPESACYRCLYPTAPRQPQSCEENGVLGIVPGIIGCLQALETVKVLTKMGKPSTGSQLLFDAYDSQFRRLKITKRRADCVSCGQAGTETPTSNFFCGSPENDIPIVGAVNRLGLREFARLREDHLVDQQQRAQYVLLDTRPPHQFEMVHFPEAINVPFQQLQRAHAKGKLTETVAEALLQSTLAWKDDNRQVLVICRRGVDSVTVTSWLLACGMKNVFNVEGGYTQYADEHSGVDKNFPMY